MTLPTPLNCLNGTNGVSYCGLDPSSVVSSGYWGSWKSSAARKNKTMPGGTILVFTCSNGDYIANTALGPEFMVLNCWGQSIRHLGQLFNDPAIAAMCQRAGAIVLYGFLQNWIDQEYAQGRSETQVLGSSGNVPYILQGVANWLTGKGVIVEATPVRDANLPTGSYCTNARMDSINNYVHSIFGNKTGWEVAEVNATLKGGGSELATTYYDAAEHPHVNDVALTNVIIPEIKSKLVGLGVL